MEEVEHGLEANVARRRQGVVRPTPVEVGRVVGQGDHMEGNSNPGVANTEVDGEREVLGVPLPVAGLDQLVRAPPAADDRCRTFKAGRYHETLVELESG